MTYKQLIKTYMDIAKLKAKEKEAIKCLVLDILNIDSNDLYLIYDEEIKESLYLDLKNKIHLYLDDDIPVQYISGYANFYGLRFKVNANVLIPRFDTEILVEEVIHIASKLQHYDKIKILDIGTGSGCIAISLKMNIINSVVTASDISFKALKVAKENAKLQDTSISFVQSDLFDNITGKFDFIVSNPPYIDFYSNSVDKLVRKNEPPEALFASEKGIYFYNQILSKAKDYITDNSYIVFEIGYDQASDITNLAYKYFPKAKVSTKKDLSGLDRVITIKI